MKCYTYNGITLDEESLFKAIKEQLNTNQDLSKLAAVIYKLDNPKGALDQLQYDGQQAQEKQKKSNENERPYIPVTKFSTSKHTILGGKRLTPEYNDANRKAEYIKSHLAEFGQDEAKAAASYDEQISTEQINNKVGTYIHNLVNILLTEGKGNKYDNYIEELKKALKTDAKELTSDGPSKDKPDAVKQDLCLTRITKIAQELADWVKSEYGKDYEIYSEMPMLLKATPSRQLNCSIDNQVARDYEGIIGISDLVLLNKTTNKIIIVDYKVSSRPYNEWYQAKANEVDYQLALYRAILTEQGFDGDDIDLKVKPILFHKENIESLKVEPTVNCLDATYKGASRVAWRGGTFTEQLRQLGIGSSITAIVDTELYKKIEEDRKNIIIYNDPKQLSKNYFIENDKIEKYKDQYRFWSKLNGPHGGYIYAKTKEEFTKDGGILDQYISQLVESRNQIGSTILAEIKEFRDALQSGREPNLDSFLRSSKNGKRAQLLQSVLGKYVDSSWELLSEKLPSELIDMGILVFSKEVRGETVLDIVSIAEGPLSMNVEICGNHFVVGKYVNDRDARNIPNVMASDYRNVKAIEACSILNTLIGSHPDKFDNVKLGNMIVLNPNGEVSNQFGLDWNQILDNFDIICDEKNANIKNNLRKLQRPKTYEYCQSELARIINNLKEDSKLKKLLKDIDDGDTNLRTRIATINRLLELLRKVYPQCRNLGISGNDTINVDDNAQQVYILLSQMNNDLHGIRPEFTGRLPKMAFTLQEFFSALGILRFGNQALTDNTGDKIVGFGNGLLMSSPRTTASKTLQQLFAYYDAKYLSIRKEFENQTVHVSNLTHSYISKVAGNQFLNSSNRKHWERLLVHDENGQINKAMLIKNPYDKTNDLTEDDRIFLKSILWEINKYKCTDSNLDRKWKYDQHEKEIMNSEWFKENTLQQESSYFYLPLSKASRFDRAASVPKLGLKTWWNGLWKEFEESYDPRRYHDIRRRQLKKESDIFMDNPYDINEANRKEYIDNINNPYDFSFDLDYLALDVAFTALRKEHFDEAVMLTETVLVTMNFMQQNDPNMDFTDEMEVARDQLKITQGKSILTKEQEKLAKPLGAVKMLNSVVNLAFRPLSFLKEMSFGMITNYSRAWSLKYGSNELSVGLITQALGIVWGDRINKTGKAVFGDGRLSDFTLCEKINHLYGIANQDLNRSAKNSSISRTGLINNMSQYMYIAQSAPDYYNRLTLFIAKMLKDGCFEAHVLNPDGTLTYDWKKDKRFSELAAHGLNSNYSSPEYNKQKALYVRMCQDFEKAGENLINYNPETKKVEYGDITSAYTSDQRASIKEVADTAFGFYDHETKSQINNKFLGLVFLQFQTFLSAKYNLWLKGSTRKGDNTAQGKYVQMVRNGEKYYNRHKIDENGNYLGSEIVPESVLSEEEKRTCIPAMEWEGDFVEGLMYSILYTIRDISTFNWSEIKKNPQRMVNVMLALHDILIGIIFYNILKFIFSGGTNKTKDIKPLQRVFLRSLQDVGPSAFTQVSLTPSFVNTLETIKNDGLKLLVDSDKGWDAIQSHFGGTRDWIWDEN